MELEYAVVDVFAERALEGNPLAVFADARGLETEQMQAIAKEMNLSETTFIVPAGEAEEAADGVRVRIFTTREELPFAGHPTLGTASWLYWHHAGVRGQETVRLKLNAGGGAGAVRRWERWAGRVWDHAPGRPDVWRDVRRWRSGRGAGRAG